MCLIVLRGLYYSGEYGDCIIYTLKNVLLQFSALFDFFMHTRECHIVNASDADFKVFHL